MSKIQNIKRMLPKYRQLVSMALNQVVMRAMPTDDSINDGHLVIEFTVFGDVDGVDEAGSALATSVLANYPYDGEETATAVVIIKRRDSIQG